MKKNIIIFIILVFTFFSFPIVVEGQQINFENNKQTLNNENLLHEIEILSEKFEILKYDNDRILSTALWVLGISTTFVIAIISIYGYFNMRMSEKERTALKEEMKGLLIQRLEETKNEIDDKYNKQVNNMNKKFRKLEKNNKLVINNILDEKLSSINTEINTLQEDIYNIRIDIAKHEIELKKDGPKSTLLRYYIEYVEICLEKNIEWRINDSLKEIEKLIDDIKPLNSFEEGKVISLLKALPKDYEIAKGRISEMLKNT
ncbi:hypothetical protein C7954_1478 [Halanaerobium congolense]|jgi:hypothetical protein|uniref:Uncharacterized protein n=1 Tax=Halanaerobium congolense TaxID=54121 RepID=A0A4R8GBC5_9FIRM|nr:hypothetical protein [Halanaerobium congolense]TDX36563.1 hypothetical protein C7954_1478 [Halanaerobium congolense]